MQMRKQYIVSLSDEQRATLHRVIKEQQGTAQKVRRAHILLKTDAGWTDQSIAETIYCRRKTVENVRERYAKEGFEVALNGRARNLTRITQKKLSGEQEAQIIALRLGAPPPGYGQWSLRLLAYQAVELEIVESISHETIRQTLKQTA